MLLKHIDYAALYGIEKYGIHEGTDLYLKHANGSLDPLIIQLPVVKIFNGLFLENQTIDIETPKGWKGFVISIHSQLGLSTMSQGDVKFLNTQDRITINLNPDCVLFDCKFRPRCLTNLTTGDKIAIIAEIHSIYGIEVRICANQVIVLKEIGVPDCQFDIESDKVLQLSIKQFENKT